MSLILEKISLLPICDFYLNLLVFHSLDYPTFLVSPLLFILAPTAWVARSTFVRICLAFDLQSYFILSLWTPLHSLWPHQQCLPHCCKSHFFFRLNSSLSYSVLVLLISPMADQCTASEVCQLFSCFTLTFPEFCVIEDTCNIHNHLGNGGSE